MAEIKRNKRTENDVYNTTQKTKYQATGVPLKIKSELGWSGRVSSSSSTSGARLVMIVAMDHTDLYAVTY